MKRNDILLNFSLVTSKITKLINPNLGNQLHWRKNWKSMSTASKIL
jgi:hypothetical protein